MSEDRLTRIEVKLDEVGQAIVALARIEERMVSLFKRMDNLDLDQGKNSNRIRKLEDRVGSNGHMLRFAERVFWIVLAAGVSYLFWMARG